MMRFSVGHGLVMMPADWRSAFGRLSHQRFLFAVSLLLANVEPNKPTESVDPKILGKWEL